MKKQTPILLAVAALLMAVALYQLPKVVVDDGDDVLPGAQTQQTMPDAEAPANAHLQPIPPTLRPIVSSLQAQLADSENSEEYRIFADSLAGVYYQAAWYDSAAYYAEVVVDQNPGLASWKQAGNYYYEAFSFASNGQAQTYHAGKAQEYLQKVMEADANDLEAKAKLGMTYVVSDNPMQGVLMMREVVEQEPGNVLAQFNLGMLSRQSGQLEKAVERFSTVVSLEPDDLQARFFLGMSYQDMGDAQNAKLVYEDLLDLTRDPSIIDAVQSQLESLE